jgi:hypothetical protein
MTNEIYDQSLEYIKVSYLYGIVKSVKETHLYKIMTPQLKNRLTFELLENYYKQFYYFFNDDSAYIHADKVFIRKIITNLDCLMYNTHAN